MAEFKFWLDSVDASDPLRQRSVDNIRLVPWSEEDSNAAPKVTGLPTALLRGKSLLAKRPASWPTECPRFCVIAFESSSLEANIVLADLLDDAISTENCFFEGGNDLDEEDRQFLREWLVILEKTTRRSFAPTERYDLTKLIRERMAGPPSSIIEL